MLIIIFNKTNFVTTIIFPIIMKTINEETSLGYVFLEKHVA